MFRTNEQFVRCGTGQLARFGKGTSQSTVMNGASHRGGMWWCLRRASERQFRLSTVNFREQHISHQDIDQKETHMMHLIPQKSDRIEKYKHIGSY